MKYFSIYLDETGNTGSNYADNSQPFFIVGGWCGKATHTIGKTILRWEKDTFKHQKKEFKFCDVKKQHKISNLIELFKKELSKDLFPCFYIVEKKYLLCKWLLINLYDPAYNKRCDEIFLRDLKKQEHVNDLMYSIFSNKDIDWFNLIQMCFTISKDISCFKRIVEYYNSNICSTCSEYKLPMTNFFLESSLSGFNINDKKMMSLVNIIGINHIMNVVQEVEKKKSIPIKIYYDQIKSLMKTMDVTFSTLVSKVNINIEMLNGYKLTFGSNCNSSLYHSESENIPFLRIADYYVGYLNYCLSNNIYDDLFLTAPILLCTDKGNSGYFSHLLSKEMLTKIFDNRCK